MDSTNDSVRGILEVTLGQTRDLENHDFRQYEIVFFDTSYIICGASFSDNKRWPYDGRTWRFDVTRPAELQIWLYRHRGRLHSKADTFLGKTTFQPSFTNHEASPVWLNLHGKAGAIKITTKFIPADSPLIFTRHFERMDILSNHSTASMSPTIRCRKKDSDRFYVFIIMRPWEPDYRAENPAAIQINCPFILPLRFALRCSDGRRFLACTYLNYSLSEYLERRDHVDFSEARLFAAQLFCIVECLHGLDITWGRFRPQNIYIDPVGYLAFSNLDIYAAKKVDNYLSPEIQYTKNADWWSFGTILYEILTGHLPPKATDNNYSEALAFPASSNGIPFPKAAEDLLTRLLDLDPLRRLGANGPDEVKSHPFFDEIDWDKLVKKEYVPSFQAPLPQDRWPGGEEFCAEEVKSVWRKEKLRVLSDELLDQFEGFEYVRPGV
ncbi:kinase-like protein [Aspergillus sclerotiicarbonarius CBS 121057]|uniref:Kinase-like protein n=1 Tax=Aspergillus sclerotiicarbonarius (strain CBS 121057 / IBT 28362) TaxID=1448318 RepID=A0A319EC24_ASPSB|nr:kinase-like protein [Aspergillus sclerotiicarbonarius CBS 121057]